MGTDMYRLGGASERFRSITHAIGLIVGAFVVGALLANIVLSGYAVETLEDLPPFGRAAVDATQFVGFMLVGWGYIQWRDDSLFEMSLPGLRELGIALVGIVGLFVVLNIASTVLQTLGIEAAANDTLVRGRQQPTYLLYLVVVSFLFTAPAEELIFRGLVQGLFRRAYGVVPGVIIASLIFGGIHYIALSGQGSKLAYLTIAAILGVLLGVLYEWTENLTVPILVHGSYNAILFTVQYLNTTGQLSIP